VLTIFKYTEPHVFLKDAWQSKKAQNPAFSMRSWARKLGFENNSPLSLMLAGKRPIPKKYVPAFAEDLELNSEESVYLATLVDYGNSKDLKEKMFYLGRLKELSPESLEQFELVHFKFLGDPIHMCILEMMDLQEFEPTASWVKERLLFPASVERIQSALDRLLALGLVEKCPSGRLRKKHRHLSSRSDVYDEGLRNYHQEVSRLAGALISRQSNSEREYNGYAMNINRDKLPRAKQLITEFAERFIREVEAAPGEATTTYQLNVQLFGLAGLKDSDTKKH
jgi:uncharacterized protein (TIGR02147 family)